jgi:hypothetical protein
MPLYCGWWGFGGCIDHWFPPVGWTDIGGGGGVGAPPSCMDANEECSLGLEVADGFAASGGGAEDVGPASRCCTSS